MRNYCKFEDLMLQVMAVIMIWIAVLGMTAPVLADSCTVTTSDCRWTRLLTDKKAGQWPALRDIAVDGEGNSYVVGEAYPDKQAVALLAKYGVGGDLIWIRHLAAPASSFTTAYGIVGDKSGNTCISGTTDGRFAVTTAKNDNGFVAQYDKSGKQVWAVNTRDPIHWVGMDEASNCYAASTSYVYKYNVRGNLVWSYRGAVSAMTSAYGKVYITYPDAESLAPHIKILDANGKELRSLAPALGQSLAWSPQMYVAPALAADSGGNIYLQSVVSGVDRSGVMRVKSLLVKFDDFGKLLWERSYGADGFRWDSSDIALDAQGNSYLVGRKISLDKSAPSDVFVLSYRPDGNLRWMKNYGGALPAGSAKIAVHATGNYYIVGWAEGDLDGQANPINPKTDSATPFVARNRP